MKSLRYFLLFSALTSLSFSHVGFAQTNDPKNINNRTSVDIDRSLTGFESVDEAQSLWEFGAGGGVFEVANYPGSAERNFIALAAPYFIYRGDIFRIGGGNGARAVVVDEKDFEVDISFGGAFSADSEDGTVREGMPELDFLFEVGPQAVFRLKDYSFEKGGNARLNARIQARAAFVTDFSKINHQGYVLNPVITYQQRDRLREGTALSLSAGFVFATEDVHDYFYEVAPEFVTQDRSAFDAKGGYLGTELGFSFSFPLAKNVRAFAGAGAQIHSGSANEDSPLFEKSVTYSFALGFVWRLYQSEAKASW